MFARARSILLAAAVALGATTPAMALTPQVRDEGHFFSADAVQTADRVIREIKDRYGKDLLIETFKTVPADRAEEVKNMGRPERERFFEEWARGRARQEGVNGVYVLICKEPGHVQVEVGNETRQRAFTIENRDHLRDILVKAFQAKEYDKGLLDGVQYVRDTMAVNVGERGRSPAGGPVTPVPGGEGPAFPEGPRSGFGLAPWILGLLCLGVVGLFVVLALVSWLRRAGSGYAPGGGYGPAAPSYGYGGGGGFLSSLFGSLFGSAAGNWVYDRMFRGGSPNYGNGYPSSPPASSPDMADRPDTDYSGTGGDFDPGGSADQDGGGGDFGGGDVGGGDFAGAGDSGGGGDF